MAERTWPPVAVAADLTTEHYGLLVSWQPPVATSGPLEGLLPPRRTVLCEELRRWIHDGRRQVEISDLTPRDGMAGRAYHLDGETPVTVERRVQKPRRHAYSKLALKPGDTWESLGWLQDPGADRASLNQKPRTEREAHVDEP